MSFKKLIAAAAMTVCTLPAFAVPISGGFDFALSGMGVDTDANNVDNAIDFADYFQVADGVLDTDSSLGLINAPVTGTFANDFNVQAGFPSWGTLFVKDINALDPMGNNPYWSLAVDNGAGLVGTVYYNVEAAYVVDGQDPVDIKTVGLLTFEADGNCSDSRCYEYYEETEATWLASSSGRNSINVAPVPAPGTLALLGLGLAGLGLARRRQKAA